MPSECFIPPCPIINTTNATNSTGGELVLPHAWGHNSDDDAGNDGQSVSKLRAQALSVYQVALPLIFGLIIAVGIVGNVMVIYVICVHRKLRTFTNFLLLNLAVADVAFLVICGPFTMAHYALTLWPLGDALCRTIQFFLYTTCYVTIYTLVAVSVVRYMLVVRGGSPACVININNVGYVIIGIWCACLLINIPVPLTYGLNVDPITNQTQCVISCQVEGQRFFPIFFAFAYAIPLVIVSVLYVLLVRHIWLKQRNSSARSSTGSESGIKKPCGGTKSAHVTRVLILVVLVFALCWLPLQVHLLRGTFGTLPETFTYQMCLIAWHALVFLNSALNPIIYNLFSSEFRESFKAIFSCTPGQGKDVSVNSGSGSRGALLKN